MFSLSKKVTAFVLFIVLAGCASNAQQPESISKQDILQEQPPLHRQLGMGEALARAMLYNLDNRVQSMERVIAQGNANLEHFNMLPKMTVTAGYFRRDREDLSSSRNAITGLSSPATGTSSDREQVVGTLGETWSVLDFGIAMVRTKQLRAQEQAAIQRQRQSLQNILNETRYAYARADIAQRTKVEVDAMLQEINNALAAQERVERSGVAVPLDILQQQRNLLSIYNELLSLRQVLVAAERELNALVSLPPGMNVTLTPQTAADIPEPLKLQGRELEFLEVVALLMHPELRIADNEVFVHQREIRRTLLSMMPDLELSSIGNYGSNDFSVYSVYNTLGAKVTHNLVNLYKLPVLREHDQKRLQLEEQKRLALSLAVVTKVHVALANFNALRDEYAFAAEQAATRTELAKTLQAQYQAGEISLHERLTAQLFALDARLNAELLGTDVENAIGQVYTNIGIDTIPRSIVSDNLAVLSVVLQERVRAFSDINENLIAMAVNKVSPEMPGF
jgi:outer membrane protein TolC